jgi:hypothetical protein
MALELADGMTDAESLALLTEEERAALLEGVEDDTRSLEKIINEGTKALPDNDGSIKEEATAANPEDTGIVDDTNDEETDPDLMEQERQFAEEQKAKGIEDATTVEDNVARLAREAAEAAAAASPADLPPEISALAPVPIPTVIYAPPVDNYAERMAEVDAKWENIEEQWTNGEITNAEKNTAFREYIDSREALRDANRKHEDYLAANQAAHDTKWVNEQRAFIQQAFRETGVNYMNPEQHAVWNDWVKRLADDPKNADKDGMWFLEQAHKKACIELDIPLKRSAPNATKTAAPAPQAKPDAKKVPNRQPDLNKVPPTLGRLPAAADGDAGEGGEFAHMDGLEGTDYEVAIARMSEDQKKRWLAS